MELTLPSGKTVEVKTFLEASETFKSEVRGFKGDLPDNAGEIRGGAKKLFMGQVDRQGDIYNGSSWPYTNKIFDNRLKK